MNLEQVRVGLAWWYREYANEQPPAERVAYEAVEIAVKAQKR
ncbi:MAG: hypothetical protein WD823_00115 [Sulfuricaulis sp.]